MLLGSMGAPYKITPKRQQTFLDVLSETGNITEACKAIKVSRMSLYRFRKKNKKFAEAWEEAEYRGVDALIEEARRRAHDGVDEPHFYQDQIVGYVRKYSDTLLIFLIKAKRPEYRDTYQMNMDGTLTVKIVKFTDGSKHTK